MANPRAWSFLTIDGIRQYGGNVGYLDDPSAVYRYDSNVQHWRQVSEGDVIVLRSRNAILGVAKIERIVSGEGEKERLRCPVCGTIQIKERVTMQPRWACRDRHTFDEPRRETVRVRTFEARYDGTFRAAPGGLTVQHLSDAVLRPSDQMSIKEIDLARIEPLLCADLHCRQLVVDYADAISPSSSALPQQSISQSIIETRRQVMREVSLRRGQSRFRDRLIDRYGGVCQISRCAFLGLIEAAHVAPYSVTGENGAHNGLLLRSDLHTLFDLGLLAIHPATLKVALNMALLETEYVRFEGVPLFTNGTAGPDNTAITARWALFERQLPKSGATKV